MLAELDEILAHHAELRPGKMFGCPGYFLGAKAVACLFGEEVCLTLPQPRVDELVGRPGFRRFVAARGRPMSGWVLISAERLRELAREPLLVDEAIAHARSKALRPPAGKRR